MRNIATNLEIPLIRLRMSNSQKRGGTLHGGQFIWGGCLLKGNGGVRRQVRANIMTALEHNGTSLPDCETYQSNRDESRRQ